MDHLITIGQLLDLTINQYKKYYKELIALAGIIVIAGVPFAIANNLWGTALIPALVLTGVGLVLALLAKPLASSAIITAIHAQNTQRTITFGNALLASKRRLLPIIGAGLATAALLCLCYIPLGIGLVGVMYAALVTSAPGWMGLASLATVLIGAALALVSSLWVSTALVFSYFFITLENTGALNGLRASIALTRGRFWEIFFRLFVIGIIFVFLTFVIGYIAQIVLYALGILFVTISPIFQSFFTAVSDLMGIILAACSLPLFLLVQYHLYVDLKKP